MRCGKPPRRPSPYEKGRMDRENLGRHWDENADVCTGIVQAGYGHSRNAAGRTYAIEVGDYFRHADGGIKEWLFSAPPPEVREGLRHFRVLLFTKTLSERLSVVISAGFAMERIEVPCPSDENFRE